MSCTHLRKALLSIASILIPWKQPGGSVKTKLFCQFSVKFRIKSIQIQQVNLRVKIGIINQSSHPHISSAGSFNIGQILGKNGPHYAVVHYPLTDGSEHPDSIPASVSGTVVARAPCRSLKEPSYMHSFCITENYYVLVEQPLCVRLQTVVWSLLTGKPIVHALKWRPKMGVDKFDLLT